MEVELVQKTHHVDSDGPDADGMVRGRYEYDILVLRIAAFEADLRTYSDAPEEVSFLRFRDADVNVGLGDAKKSYRVEIGTITGYLRGLGYRSVKWMGGPAGGYEEVPF